VLIEVRKRPVGHRRVTRGEEHVKKTLAVGLIAGAMAVSVALPAVAQDDTSVEGKTVTLMVGVQGDPFYISMQCGAQEAANALGMSLDVQGPDRFDATLQNPMLDAVSAAAPDVLLVAPNDRVASAGPIANIQEGGTTVVLVDTTVDDTSIGVSRIATDNKLGGVKAAEALETLGLVAGDKVLGISVNPGITSTDLRMEGFIEKADELGFVLVAETLYSNNEASKAAEIITAQLAADPDLKGVFAANLFTAQGVATGVRQAGAEDVQVVGFDAGPDQVLQLQAGDVQALVAQQPFTIGQMGVEQAAAALTGGEVTPEIQTESTVVTADNIDDPEVSKFLYTSDC
jgi:ribose transport system substrate-binding protein